MNKLSLLFFCFILFSSIAGAIQVKPFMVFSGEQVQIEFESKIHLIEMDSYYNLSLVEECQKSNCPVFENGSLKDSDKKKFILKTDNLRSGFYSFKVFEQDSNEFYFSSFVVRQDYRLLIGLGVFLLVILLIAVETNAFKRFRKQ